MNIVGFVFARGGSKGLPRKNVRLLGGKPLIAHAIDTAFACRQINEVIVSTDDPEIAAVARSHGADVVERPDELATSTATSESALLHVLDALAADGTADPAVCLLVQCTSPFIHPDDLDGVTAAVLDGGAEHRVELRAGRVGVHQGHPPSELGQVHREIHGNDARPDAATPARHGNQMASAARRRLTGRFRLPLFVDGHGTGDLPYNRSIVLGSRTCPSGGASEVPSPSLSST